MKSNVWTKPGRNRRYFIGGSDARIIMGDDEAALNRLWREKRGEIEPEDLSGNLIVQLGVATEELNRRWYQANTGQLITDVQRQIRHPVLRWGPMGAQILCEVKQGRFHLLGFAGNSAPDHVDLLHALPELLKLVGDKRAD